MSGGTVGPRVTRVGLAGWTLPWLSVAVLCLATACEDRPATVPIEELNAACALIVSCRAADGPVFTELLCNLLFENSYDSSDRGSGRALGYANALCLLRARDCDDVHACSKATSTQAAQCDGTDRAYCMGDVGVRCFSDGRPPEANDCAAAGLVCGSDGTWTECGTAPCDPGSDDDRCQDGVLYQCTTDLAVWRTRDCAFNNQSCSVNDSGHGNCYDTGDQVW